MLKSNYIPILIGSAVGAIFAVLWHFVNIGHIPLSISGMMVLSNITFALCPGSLMLMDVNPVAPVDFEQAILYLSAILLNGLLYAVVGATFRKLARRHKAGVGTR